MFGLATGMMIGSLVNVIPSILTAGTAGLVSAAGAAGVKTTANVVVKMLPVALGVLENVREASESNEH